MGKFYPPSIEGTLPAFTNSSITIPFVMNKTVSWNTIKGFVLKVKNITNNSLIGDYNSENYSRGKQEVYFNIISDINKFKIGQFYKVQLAYRNSENEIGYFSTVGIIKYTAVPKVTITGLTPAQLHTDLRTYIGNYSQKGKDVTEKVYSYRFDVYDEDKQLLETSGEQLHNHENDENIYSSYDSFTITKSLEPNKIYKIIYTVTTANGLVEPSPDYRITEQSTIPPEIDAKLLVTMNEENGYAELRLIGNKDSHGVEKVSTGTFLISRSSSEDNYGSWSEVSRFALFGEAPSSHVWRDFTLQHGFTYRYSLQQYNKDYQIYSNRMLSEDIVANFEHSFLYDGEKQLKIKYNPKVSSFKETLLESKTNTLGGKYPFFFRNGNVKYKEFPISGLISYHMDEEELFMTNEELMLEDLNNLTRQHTLKKGIKSSDYDYFNSMLDANVAYKLQGAYADREDKNSQENQITRKRDRTTNLTDYNMVSERIFKMKVLDFLNDGKPKLFRSPGEGNFIVRLMNSSLSPNDQLGRMIHTFSTTATEIDDCSYQKLNEYKIIKTDEPEIKQLRWKTVNIRELINSGKGVENNFISIGSENNIMSVQFQDMIPGDMIKIKHAAPDNEEHLIQIGATGAYYVEFNEAPQQVSISALSQQGQVTYSYYGTSLHHFDTYRKILMSDIPIMQLNGPTTLDILEEFNLEDLKYKITEYYFLNFSKINNLDPKDESLTKEGRKNKFWIDDKEFDITLDLNYQIVKPGYLPKIVLGDNIRLDISLQRREIEYDIEETDAIVANAKTEYIKAQNKLLNWIRYNSDSTDIIEVNENNDNNFEFNIDYEKYLGIYKTEYQKKYNNFLIALEAALKAKEVPLE